MARATRYAHLSDFTIVADAIGPELPYMLGVTTATVRRWRAGEAKIPWAAYQLAYERSKYGLGARDAAENFERNMILGERDALQRRVEHLENELVRVSSLVDWQCANDPFIDAADPRACVKHT